MKVKILRNLGAGLPDYQEGQEVDTKTAKEGQDLIDAGLAVPLTAKSQEPRAEGQPKAEGQAKPPAKTTKK